MDVRFFAVFCLCVIPVTVYAEMPGQNEKDNWFVDLGGKTVDVVGLNKPLTGVRAGRVLPHNINLGVEAFTLTESAESRQNQNIRKQNSYNYFGAHVEYAYKLNDRLSLLPALSVGIGLGTYEEQDGDFVSTGYKSYPSLEPSIYLSVKLIKSMWLNLGGSYFFVGNEPGFENGAALNIFARYMW